MTDRMVTQLLALVWFVATPGHAGEGEGDRYASRCAPASRTRINNPQGTMLWGARQSWDPRAAPDERASVLVSVDLERPIRGSGPLALRGGRLEAGGPLAEAVLRGTSSSGQSVEVAICA